MIPQPCDQLVVAKASPDRCVRCEHPVSAHGRGEKTPAMKSGWIWGDTVRADLCTTCRRQIYKAQVVKSGATMPFDMRPQAIAKASEMETGRERWLVNYAASHWATCPDAKKHRRPR